MTGETENKNESGNDKTPLPPKPPSEGQEPVPQKPVDSREAPAPQAAPKPVPPKPVEPKAPDATGAKAMQTVTQVGETKGDSITRRSFIKVLTFGWIAFAAAVSGAGIMVLRFMFPNVLFEPKQSFKAGKPADYSIGEVSLKWKGKHGVWLVRDNSKLYALSTVCTHLGCTPNWLATEGKFKCPCHGSGFYITGINFEGPAPRPLERYKIELTDDGQILIDKTKKFQQEKGEWKDPESFLLV